MKETPLQPHRTHLRSYLAAGYALFIAYASLAPFSGWQEQGLSFYEVLSSPLSQTFTWFDFTINWLAYLPFGFLLAMLLRTRFHTLAATLLAMALGLATSALMEYAQMYLPSRVSSNSDLISNGTGAACGALLAAKLETRSWFVLMRRWYWRWFRRGGVSDFGVALVALWMFVQINPSLPMLGSVFISEVQHAPFEAVPATPFSWLESMAVALNLLMPGVLFLTLLREQRYTLSFLLLALGLVTLAKFFVAAVLLKSWALLLWLNSEAMLGIFAGILLVIAARLLSRKQLTVCAALAVLAHMVLVHWVMGGGGPASAMRLFHWHYGHMLNYNGLSQMVALLFPLLLLGYLLASRSR